jgi:HK97 family phage major capsid protein
MPDVDGKNYEAQLLEKMDAVVTSVEKKLGEGEKSYTDMQGTIKSLEDTLLEVKAKYTELEESMSTRAWKDVPGSEDSNTNKFSFFKAFNAIRSKDFSQAGYEQEVMQASATKAQAAGVDTAGGYLVPMQALGGIIELLRANMVVSALGATVLSDLTGVPVEIPKQTGSASAVWVEENATITESEITFGQLALNPKGLAALVKMSNRSLRLTNPALEGLVRDDMVQQIGLALDLAALRGTGANGSILGVSNQIGVGSIDFSSTTESTTTFNPSWEGMYELEGVLEDANALRGKLAFAMSPKVKRVMSKLRAAVAAVDDQGGAFMSTMPMTSAHITAILGWPFQTTTQIPNNIGAGSDKSEIYFGNWADLIIGMWGGMRLKASDEAGTAFASDQTWVRAIMDVDAGVRFDIHSFFCSLCRACDMGNTLRNISNQDSWKSDGDCHDMLVDS